MHKLLVLFIVACSLLASPVSAAAPGAKNNPVQEVKDAKRLTPVLDLLADELEKVGVRLFDNALYSMERLWQDTVGLKTKGKSKI